MGNNFFSSLTKQSSVYSICDSIWLNVLKTAGLLLIADQLKRQETVLVLNHLQETLPILEVFIKSVAWLFVHALAALPDDLLTAITVNGSQ